eukprot:scaffold15967_cov55-Phaeocystis_antarctica.AAC.4
MPRAQRVRLDRVQVAALLRVGVRVAHGEVDQVALALGRPAEGERAAVRVRAGVRVRARVRVSVGVRRRACCGAARRGGARTLS